MWHTDSQQSPVLLFLSHSASLCTVPGQLLKELLLPEVPSAVPRPSICASLCQSLHPTTLPDDEEKAQEAFQPQQRHVREEDAGVEGNHPGQVLQCEWQSSAATATLAPLPAPLLRLLRPQPSGEPGRLQLFLSVAPPYTISASAGSTPSPPSLSLLRAPQVSLPLAPPNLPKCCQMKFTGPGFCAPQCPGQSSCPFLHSEPSPVLLPGAGVLRYAWPNSPLPPSFCALVFIPCLTSACQLHPSVEAS